MWLKKDVTTVRTIQIDGTGENETTDYGVTQIQVMTEVMIERRGNHLRILEVW